VAVLLALVVVLLAAQVITNIATNRLLHDVGRLTHSVCVLNAHAIRQRYTQETPGQYQPVIRHWVVTGTCVRGVVRSPPPPP